MAFFNGEGDNPQFEFEGGYRISFASGSSFFDVNRVERPQEGIWPELNEAGYRLIGNQLFTIDTASKNPGVLSGTSPRLHIELALPLQNLELWYEKGYVVLILDNDRASLVDWAVANHTPDVSSFFEPAPDIAAIYFDIPLVPVSRQSAQAEHPGILPDDRAGFLDRIGQWEKGQQLLTFGVFSFEDKDIDPDFHRFYHGLPALSFHPLVRKKTSWLAGFIARKADRYLKHNTGGDEQLQVIRPDGRTREATTRDLRQMQGRVLLLCHGIFSSTEGAFSATKKEPGILDDQEFLECLRKNYGQNILAWDHYTLSKTTAENAADLLNKLNELNHVDLDIVCHSRGAGVIRNLVENDVNQQQLMRQNVCIQEIIFVAGACLGSQLADSQNTNRLFRWLNMIYWFFGGAPAGFISGILTVLKLLATVAQKMPGVEAMNPTSKEIATLNRNNTTRAHAYNYIRANFDYSKLPAKIAQEFLWDTIVFGRANDLVVPYDGASASKNYLPNFPGKNDAWSFGTATQSQSVVRHTNFFVQAATKKELRTLLKLIC
jgi:hypothetical protein